MPLDQSNTISALLVDYAIRSVLTRHIKIPKLDPIKSRTSANAAYCAMVKLMDYKPTTSMFPFLTTLYYTVYYAAMVASTYVCRNCSRFQPTADTIDRDCIDTAHYIITAAASIDANQYANDLRALVHRATDPKKYWADMR